MLTPQKELEKSQTQIENLISRLRGKGYEEIKADIPGYDSPTTFHNRDKDYAVTPDLTARRKGRKGYFEVARKTENVSRLVTKWKLLQRFAKAKNGVFRIFVPRGHMRFTRDTVAKYNIEADLVKI